MQTSSRQFSNDLSQINNTRSNKTQPVNTQPAGMQAINTQAINMLPASTGGPFEKPLVKRPESIQNTQNNAFESLEYKNMVLEKANENARIIKEQAEKEINGILNHIERIKLDYEIETSRIEERIEKKQNIIFRLNSLMSSLNEDSSSFSPVPSNTEELYKSINNRTKKLSILTEIFNDLLTTSNSLKTSTYHNGQAKDCSGLLNKVSN